MHLLCAAIAFSLSGWGRDPHQRDLHPARSGVCQPFACLLADLAAALSLTSLLPMALHVAGSLQVAAVVSSPLSALQGSSSANCNVPGFTFRPNLVPSTVSPWSHMALSSFTRCRTHQGAVALMGSSQPLKTAYPQQLQHVRLMQHARCSPAMATLLRLAAEQLYPPGRSAVSLNSCSGSRCSTAPGLVVGRGWQTA
jgi:hypothetical protein